MTVEESYAIIQFHSPTGIDLASAIVTTAITLHLLTFLLWLYVSWHYVGDIANACGRLVASWRERRPSFGRAVVVLSRRSAIGL